MAITPFDLLNHAEQIMPTASEEVHYRECARQSYYAAYHRCLEVISILGIETLPNVESQSIGEHTRVFTWLMYLPINKRRNTHIRDYNLSMLAVVGRSLRDMLGVRKSADYSLNLPFTRAEAGTQLAKAQKLFDEINEIVLDEKSSNP